MMAFFKVMEDGQEIGAYLFRRTVPSIHLSPDDVRWMVHFHLYLCEAFSLCYLKYASHDLTNRIDVLCL